MLGVQQGPSLKDAYPTVKEPCSMHVSSSRVLKDVKARQSLPTAKRPLEENPNHALLVEELLENSRPFGPQSQAMENGAPTDFSGLIPKSFATDCQHDSKRPRTIRTFGDIASQRQGSNRGPLRELPSNQDYLPPPLAAPAIRSAAGGGAQTAAERQLPTSACAPIDWSLKTAARFSSTLPFSICDSAQQASGREVCEVQRCVSSCGSIAALSLPQQYLAALHSFQHPAAPRAVPAGSRVRGPDSEALDRRADWQAAFSSLYDNFRNGQCAAFYYVAPEGSSKGFVAFFGAAGVGGRQRLHAILTRSTSGTRALLGQGLGLGFATPLMPSEDAPAATAAAAEEGGASTQSMLVFEGALRVHGLFDFLLNESWRMHGDECDVPTLLSPTPFLHSCLRAQQPKVLGAASGRDASKAQHRVELRGLLPPWVLDRLCCIFTTTQDGGFTMLCDTHPHTLSLNWQPSEGAACSAAGMKDDYAARERGCLDAEEAGRWQQAVPGLSCNVVRELRCEGGSFVARLSDKSAARLV